MRLWALGLGCALIAFQPALAEYGPTRWGMTADEVVAAIGAGAEKVRDRSGQRVHDHKHLAASRFEEGGIAYVANYYFGKRGDGLTMVRVEPATPQRDCAAMRAAYVERLGPGIDQPQPVVAPRFRIVSIQWPTGPGTEVVEFTEIRIDEQVQLCHALYQQRDFVKN